MNNFLSDYPLGSNDPIHAQNDLFDWKDYAKTIASQVMAPNMQDIRSLSVEGSWGSGKSSLISLVRDEIKAISPNAIMIDFKPGSLNKDDSIQDKFIHAIYRGLKHNAKLKKLFARFSYMIGSNVISMAATVIPGLGVAAFIVPKLDALVKKMTTETLSDVKKSMGAELKDTGPLMVFIDDIDRLTFDEMIELFKLVREVMNFSNTKYFLSYDRSYIENILENSKIPFPDQYLNKFTHFVYPVPKITPQQYDKFLDHYLPKIITQNSQLVLDEAFHPTVDALIKVLLPSPRQIKKMINQIAFIASRLSSQFNLSEVVRLEALFVICPTLYHYIKDNPEIFIGTNLAQATKLEYPSHILQAHEEEIDKILAHTTLNPIQSHVIRQILDELFPLIAKEKLAISHTFKINTIDGFADYFHYSLPAPTKVVKKRKASITKSKQKIEAETKLLEAE